MGFNLSYRFGKIWGIRTSDFYEIICTYGRYDEIIFKVEATDAEKYKEFRVKV